MAENVASFDIPKSPCRLALILPREHGAWGILLVPLVTGAAVGLLRGGRAAPVFLFAVAVVGLFWLRTPVESWLGLSPMRAQTSQERRLVKSAILPLAGVIVSTLGALLWHGRNRDLLWLGMVAVVLFAAQVFLKRIGRATRMAAQVVGAFALTLTAPAAYYVVTGELGARAWSLWLVNFLFAGDQIHFVWLTIRRSRATGWSEKFTRGWSFLAGQILLGGILGIAYHFGWLPGMTLLAFGPILFRGIAWYVGNRRPVAIRQLGWTELAHAVVFGILLTLGFGIAG